MTTRRLQLLEADEGMILTDGIEYGEYMWVGKGRTAKEFSEITREEYDAILAEKRQNDPEVFVEESEIIE